MPRSPSEVRQFEEDYLAACASLRRHSAEVGHELGNRLEFVGLYGSCPETEVVAIFRDLTGAGWTIISMGTVLGQKGHRLWRPFSLRWYRRRPSARPIRPGWAGTLPTVDELKAAVALLPADRAPGYVRPRVARGPRKAVSPAWPGPVGADDCDLTPREADPAATHPVRAGRAPYDPFCGDLADGGPGTTHFDSSEGPTTLRWGSVIAPEGDEGPGFGWRRIAAQHGWGAVDEVETLWTLRTGAVGAADDDRHRRFVAQGPGAVHATLGGERLCRRVVVVEFDPRPGAPAPEGIVTSFSEPLPPG